MTQAFLVSFLGGAALLALFAALALGAVIALVSGRAGWRWFPFLFAAAFFVFLTQHPFPPLHGLDCPLPYTNPQLKPFRFVHELMEAAAGGPGQLATLQPSAILMNLLLCIPIGALFARHSASLRAAVALGIGLPLLVEISQLTGIFGLYPCPYRQFDVDDLILNFTGIVGGFLLARRVRRA